MSKRSIKIKQNNSDNKNVNKKKIYKKFINVKWKDDQCYMYIRCFFLIIIKRCMGMDFLL